MANKSFLLLWRNPSQERAFLGQESWNRLTVIGLFTSTPFHLSYVYPAQSCFPCITTQESRIGTWIPFKYSCT